MHQSLYVSLALQVAALPSVPQCQLRMIVIIIVLLTHTQVLKLYFPISKTKNICFVEEIPNSTIVMGNCYTQM